MIRSTDVSKGRSGRTIDGAYFRDLYRGTEDPWGFAASAYERDKYAATLEALPYPRYRAALEVGCSIGVFTRMLAERCDALLGVDVSEEAVARAARRCAGLPNVRVLAWDVTGGIPGTGYDLLTFCEVGFYFGPRDLARIRAAIAGALVSGGVLALVHWTPLVDGHAQTADDVHDAFCEDAHFAPAVHHRSATYRLDICRRT